MFKASDLALVAPVLIAAAPRPAAAAGFDCRKAATQVEKAACADPELSQLDGKVSSLYSALRKSVPTEGQRLLKEDQRFWVQERNQTKSAAELRASY